MSDWYVQVGENVGRALTRLAPLMGTPLLVAAYFGEFYAIPGVLLSVVVTFAIGWVLSRLCRPADDASRAEVFASAGAVWLAAVLVGTLPFLTIAWTAAIDPGFVTVPDSATDPTLRAFRAPVNAWFESMSGFTGSGLTMARKESELPHTLLWWRSLSQWLGGLGVIVLTVAVVNQSGDSMLSQYYEDRTPLGQSHEDERSNEPKVLVTAFAAATLLAAALFWAAGMPAWDSLNHAMTGLATGGFVVTDTSFRAYESLAVRAAAIPVMLAGAVPLPAYYLLYRLDLRSVVSDSQIRWLFVLAATGSLAVLGALYAHGVYALTLRSTVHAAFQFVSAITCTGFYTVSSIGRKWTVIPVLVLTGAMGLGGASGSTASGIKIVRARSIVRGLRSRIRDPFPDEALPSLDESTDDNHASANYRNASMLTVLWVATYVLGVFVLLAALPVQSAGVPLGNVLFTVASAQGNVGLVSGVVTPSTPMVGAVTKLMLSFNMWVGRLEVVPVLVFLRVLVWDL